MHYNVFFQSFRWFLPRARILRIHVSTLISRITVDSNSSQAVGGTGVIARSLEYSAWSRRVSLHDLKSD
jgi:hypothetical protein